jgi:hypothetical protein
MFAFYEDTKVGIALTVDPQAPDPVEITAGFKETVFALAPVEDVTEGTVKKVVVADMLSHLDVRYGVNADARPGAQDILYAVLTHGMATGNAADVLASRSPDELVARRATLVRFVRRLDPAEMKAAATALAVPDIDKSTVAQLRQAAVEKVRGAKSGAALCGLEDSLEKAFSSRFRPWPDRTPCT